MWTLLALSACATPPDVADAPPVPVATAPAPAAPPPAPPAPPLDAARIVAIGDLHADLDNAEATLRLAGLIDEAGHWSGGDAILVQTGDCTDRGPQSKGVLDLIRRLQPEAEAAGGHLVALMGNHESMNILGDLRYVNPADVVEFGGPAAREAAFEPTGPYGAWLIGLGITARVGDAVFVHGGITPEFAAHGVDGINADARAALKALDKEAPVLGNTGPMWYRGFVQDPEEVACPALAKSLAALGVRRMVVGHTTRDDGRIEVRCDGRLYVVDIGISDHYGSHLGALEISNGDAKALYPDGPVDLPDPPSAPVGG